MSKERKALPKIEKNRECLKTDCKNDLHCFRQKESRRPRQILVGQHCYECGADPVDWNVVYQRNLVNTSKVFDFMKKEWIRNKYWTREIDPEALKSAQKIGHLNLRTAIAKRLKQSVTMAVPFNDGGQTPMDGNILYYAQHATACCCRKCIEYWHGIQAKREITDQEIKYMTELMYLYINDRLPNLNKEPMAFPRTKAN